MSKVSSNSPEIFSLSFIGLSVFNFPIFAINDSDFLNSFWLSSLVLGENT
jgi:hypothetical protein